MMKKILVATDFSTNSKAALRFALKLAAQCNGELTFLHVHHVPRMTSWTQETYQAYEKKEMAKIQQTLDHFVQSVYQRLKIKSITHSCVILNSPFVDSTIMSYASDHAFDFICVSARGAGILEKLFGTTTANLINQSPVPVIAVPGKYRAIKLTRILYASDLGKLASELKQVVDFARPLAATIEVLHLSEPFETVVEPEIIKLGVREFTDYPVVLQLKPRNLEITLTADIGLVVNAQKSSMLIMFTAQKEGFVERLFMFSNSVDYAYLTSVPLLVFRKS